MTYKETITCLYELQNTEIVAFKEKKFGVVTTNSLGIYQKELNMIAKEIGRNNELALQLFNSGIYEARILCSKIFSPKDVTPALMEKWVKTFDNWEICDSFCMGLFAKGEHAITKIEEWATRKPEFEKRASFATMAGYCMADKKSGNEVFEWFFPIIKREAHDDRNFVKKAVNWALRSIGKRNVDLNKRAIEEAHEILALGSTAAKWIAKDALRELTKENVRISNYPRTLYKRRMV